MEPVTDVSMDIPDQHVKSENADDLNSEKAEINSDMIESSAFDDRDNRENSSVVESGLESKQDDSIQELEAEEYMPELDNISYPINASIKIGSTEYTSDLATTLFLAAEGASEMFITNDPGCEFGGTWEPYAHEKNDWVLGGRNALTRVYVKFRNEDEKETSCVSDSIFLDQNAPNKPHGISNGIYTNRADKSPVISWLESIDDEAGIDYYEVSLGISPGDDSIQTWTNVGNVTTTLFNDLDLVAGITYFANIRAFDLAGNISESSSSDGFFYNYCFSISDNDNWVFVPGDADYGTNDFCVMKYEAKNENGAPVSKKEGIPWVDLDQESAILKCKLLGEGFRLLTNPEWMTMASNISNVSENWSGEKVGFGSIFLGHSDGEPNQACNANDDNFIYLKKNSCDGLREEEIIDNEKLQKRIHILSYGSIIWDLSGNVREWIDYFNDRDKPSPRDKKFHEFTKPIVGSNSLPISELIPTNDVKSFWDDTWDSSQGIGKAAIGSDKKGGGLTRGGAFAGGYRNGIFRFRLDQEPTHTASTIGFRCSFDIP